MVTASAPGKVILFGEHAVVYGQPALAVPVSQLRARATVEAGAEEIWIDAQDLGRRYRLREAGPDDALARALHLTHESFPSHALRLFKSTPGYVVTVSSTIPPASGLGSGAAVCTAIVRALALHLGVTLTNEKLSAIVFESEKLLHGTPSGIDNTVVAYERPVYFVKGRPPEPFTVARSFQLLIADTGLPSPTRITVGDVRAAWQAEPARYEALFLAAGDIANAARAHIENGEPEALGPLMNRNQDLLREMQVSCAELELLVAAALNAGALGAKLSGGGRGGNMLALVTPETRDRVQTALEQAGAKSVIGTVVTGH